MSPVEPVWVDGSLAGLDDAWHRLETTGLWFGVGLDRHAVRATRVVFPGSFHPIHEGHLAMARIASESEAEPISLEISIANVEKPELGLGEVRERLQRLVEDVAGRAEIRAILITRAPTFAQKAACFPGSTFVLGRDTLERLVDPRFASGPEGLERDLERFEQMDSRFLAFFRQTDGGRRWEEFDWLPDQLAPRVRVVDRGRYDDAGRFASRQIRAALP